jgi:hypothetical protein
MHGKRFILAAYATALLGLNASCETVGGSSHVTRIYEVQDLVIPKQANSKPFMPMYSLLVNVVQATQLSELPKGTYTVRPEARGVLMVKAPAKMQGQVATVLENLRKFSRKKN